MKIIVLAMLIVPAFAEYDFGQLKKSDQKYYQNDSNEGKNQFERIDANVKEINKLHSEVASLKAELAILKAEVEKLKAKK